VPVGDATLHAITQVLAAGDESEAFCQLMPNCPLRRSMDILEHWQAFSRAARKFQISAVAFRGVYPHWSLEMNDEGAGRWFFGDNTVASQELRRLVCPTGAIWWARTRDFLEQRRFYGDPFHVQMMDANRGLDIDTSEDFELADLIVRGLRERDGENPLEPIMKMGGEKA
jgi:CMP-N-acetylneuraminic acid synthetase